jgi:hypothetical protein
MRFGSTLLTLLSGLCVSAALASAQNAICGGDGEASTTAAPVACVTGAGVHVTAAPAAGEKLETAPLAPEQRPAEVPNVTYIDGKLRVFAKNSTLSDILQAIAARTGAAIEIPENATERVVTQLGPAPARDVIAALLNGSHYNYVLVGSEADSAEVARVIVTAKSEKDKNDTGTAVAGVASRPGMIHTRNALQAAVMQPYQEMLQQQREQQAAAQEMQAQISSEMAEQANQAAVNEPPSSNGNANPGAPATDSSAGAPVEAPPPAEAPRAGSGNNAEKTPQQMLQDLYETRRQMIEQQRQPQQ